MRIGEIYRKWAYLSHHFCIEKLREECKQTIQSCQCFSVGVLRFLMFMDVFYYFPMLFKHQLMKMIMMSFHSL